MPESGPYGSVRGALSNECPYRDRPLSRAMTRMCIIHGFKAPRALV
jgi:hypothetical protein